MQREPVLVSSGIFEESFHPLEVSRPLEPKIGILDHIASNHFFGDTVLRQLHRFFSEVGLTDFYPFGGNRGLFMDHPLYGKISAECHFGDITWDMFAAASLVSLKDKVFDRFLFGFVDRLAYDLDPYGKVIATNLHAFCGGCDNAPAAFIDPYMETLCARWQKKEPSQVRVLGQEDMPIQRTPFMMKDFIAYSGVVIPRQIVDDIFHGPTRQGRGVGFFYGYLMRSVFNDHDRTTWFIDVVKNSGRGWEYTPLKYK